MAVSLYFGLPGAGKTTLLTYLAKKALANKKYHHVYGNIHINLPHYTYIDNDCIGTYQLENCLILIDEATLFADNRGYKTFPKHLTEFFMMHRHYNVDLVLFAQQWDGVDKKIRVITDRVYYVYKPFLLGLWFTKFYRIPYGIIIPDKNSSEKYGEIIQGYCKPNILKRLFSPWLFRPLYYRYFDSWEHTILPALPAKYQPIPPNNTGGIKQMFYKLTKKGKMRCMAFWRHLGDRILSHRTPPRNAFSKQTEPSKYEPLH